MIQHIGEETSAMEDTVAIRVLEKLVVKSTRTTAVGLAVKLHCHSRRWDNEPDKIKSKADEWLSRTIYHKGRLAKKNRVRVNLMIEGIRTLLARRAMEQKPKIPTTPATASTALALVPKVTDPVVPGTGVPQTPLGEVASVVTRELSSTLLFGFRVRIIVEDPDNPLFIAKDLVEAVGGVWNGRQAVNTVIDEYKGVRSVLTPGGTQRVSILTEAGAYMYLFRSDKKVAIPWQKHLASVVIPSIRRHGRYVVPGFRDEVAEHVENFLAMLEEAKEKSERILQLLKEASSTRPVIPSGHVENQIG